MLIFNESNYYRKDLSVMKYNRTDEENINNVVTGMRWRDIKDIFKRNADNETKRIHFGSNYYQCRINSNESVLEQKISVTLKC